MRIVGLLGLATLFGIAVLISNNRLKIRPQIIIWGTGLQFVFAMIVLRQDWLSFVGMGILLLMLLLYLFQKDAPRLGGKVWSNVIVALLGGLAAFILYLIPHAWLVLLSLSFLFLLFNSIFKWKRDFQRYAGAMFLLSGFVALVANGLYGRIIFQSFR